MSSSLISEWDSLENYIKEERNVTYSQGTCRSIREDFVSDKLLSSCCLRVALV